MKLTSLVPNKLTQLSESTKNIKINLTSKSAGSSPVNFLIYSSSNDGNLVFLAKTSKDLDIIEDLDLSTDEIIDQLVELLTRKTKVPFIGDYDYNGAGYSAKIDIEKILKKI